MAHKKQNHLLHWLLIMGFMLTSVLTVQYADYMKASVTDTPEHAAFDGTVSPIQYVPNWVYLSDQSISYSECDDLIEIPEYDTDILTASYDGYSWGSDTYNEIVNAQITYSVVYAGNYEYDHIEGAGSHPAVDIKTLEGTPVYAIANGVVEESSYSSSGFGNHIVIGHYDVPSPSNEDYTVDLFSSYSHLSDILVSEGDVVEKGQMIGRVGDTGTATTNHLHFQLDNADAPWHPYWPFTYAEYSALGYDFWDAVNAGLGIENLEAYTENPMGYVNKYMDYDADYAEIAEEEDEEESEAVTTEDIITYTYESTTTTEDESEDEPVEEATVVVESDPTGDTRDFAEIDVDNDGYVLLNNNLSVYIYLLDEDGDRVSNPEFAGSIDLVLSDDSVGDLSVDHIEADDFSNGYYQFVFSPDVEGETELSFEFEDYETSTSISVIDQLKAASGFEIEHDGSFVIGIPETITIKAVDVDGNFTPSYNVNGDVELILTSGYGYFEPSELYKGDFEYGVATVEFTATSSDDAIIKARNGGIVGFSSMIRGVLFDDVDDDDVYYTAIKYLRDTDVISGYPDGTFRTDQTVSRVEALKMIFEALDTELSDGSKLTFSDVEDNQWYTDYVATAKSLEIVDGYPDGTFRPADPVNKVELIKILLNAADISVDPVVIGDPYEDVDNLAWFAAYANHAKETNLTPVDGDTFDPGHDMTRGEVAETIYRLLAMSYNGADEYSVLLSME